MYKRIKPNAYTSEFYCTNCGQLGIPIPRSQGSDREPGHLKPLWCPWCEAIHNAVEIRGFGPYTYNDFVIEYNYGNFKNGKRIEPYRQFISKKKEELGWV